MLVAAQLGSALWQELAQFELVEEEILVLTPVLEQLGAAE